MTGRNMQLTKRFLLLLFPTFWCLVMSTLQYQKLLEHDLD